MIVYCPKCEYYYDDEFRWTLCPHATFLANDGANNFKYHPSSYRSREHPAPSPKGPEWGRVR